MNKAFCMRDIKKTYTDFALDVKDLSLGQSYVMGVVGKNYAEKSSHIKILMNLIYPDQGEVQVLGTNQPQASIPS